MIRVEITRDRNQVLLNPADITRVERVRGSFGLETVITMRDGRTVRTHDDLDTVERKIAEAAMPP